MLSEASSTRTWCVRGTFAIVSVAPGLIDCQSGSAHFAAAIIANSGSSNASARKAKQHPLVDATAVPALGDEQEPHCGPRDDLVALAEQQVNE